jgi:hypothetical protein
MVNSTEVVMGTPTAPSPTGTVDTTMALVLPTTAPSFGPFQVGVAREYLTTAAARVTSTAGDISLSVYDPATTGTGRLVNGTFTLSQPLSMWASSTSSAALAGAGGTVGGAAAPTPLISYSAPVTNNLATLMFRQNITSTEALRSGAYSKTLTFVLSTTNP